MRGHRNRIPRSPGLVATLTILWPFLQQMQKQYLQIMRLARRCFQKEKHQNRNREENV